MTRYQPTIDIWSLTQEERARLQPGQHVRAGDRRDAGRGVYLGQKRGGTDVVAWSDNARGRYRSYVRTLRQYAKA